MGHACICNPVIVSLKHKVLRENAKSVGAEKNTGCTDWTIGAHVQKYRVCTVGQGRKKHSSEERTENKTEPSGHYSVSRSQSRMTMSFLVYPQKEGILSLSLFSFVYTLIRFSCISSLLHIISSHQFLFIPSSRLSFNTFVRKHNGGQGADAIAM